MITAIITAIRLASVTQSLPACAPAGEVLPAAQLVHTPPVAANFPAAQAVQSLPASDPAGEDLPAAQLMHTSPAAANLPAAQAVQSLPAFDPAGEDLPAAQLVHTPDDEAPVVGEKVPTAQLVHTPPVTANLPAAQLVQSVAASDPAGEDLPAAQLMHAADDKAPSVTEYVPALQSLHACVPGAPLNVPAAHGAHALPLGPVCPGAHVHALTAASAS